MDHRSRPKIGLKQSGYSVLNINLNSENNQWGFRTQVILRNALNKSFEYPVFKGTRQSFPAEGRNLVLVFSKSF